MLVGHVDFNSSGPLFLFEYPSFFSLMSMITLQNIPFQEKLYIGFLTGLGSHQNFSRQEENTYHFAL